jgi:hypothetical protein
MFHTYGDVSVEVTNLIRQLADRISARRNQPLSTALLNIKISLSIALQRTNATALIDKFFEVIRRTFTPQPEPAPSTSTPEPLPSQVFNTTTTQSSLPQNLTNSIDTSSDMSMDIDTNSVLSHNHSSSGIVLLGV